MSDEIVKSEPKSAIMAGNKGLELQTFEDMWRFANCVIKSGLSPDGFKSPEAVLVCFQMGMELGLSPLQSLQNIAVIKGRPTVWGDAVPGLVETSGKQEYSFPTKIGQRNPDGSYPDGYGYRFTTKHRGRKEEYSYEFTVADAKRAKLWGKDGPWTFYPDRMLLNRARTYCLRDIYPDVLRGLTTVEEAKDKAVDAVFTVIEQQPKAMIPEEVGRVAASTDPQPAAPPATPEAVRKPRRKAGSPIETPPAPAPDPEPQTAPEPTEDEDTITLRGPDENGYFHDADGNLYDSHGDPIQTQEAPPEQTETTQPAAKGFFDE